ncbi:MAG: hypothetical protein JWO69_1966, partial [Thermoleophilia bacterium]|nr:hypothetical protein [Thermoleophilia bacterium]
GEPMWLSLPKEKLADGAPARTVGGQGELHVRTAKVARFAKMAATQPADPATELRNGVLDSVVRFGAEQGGTAYSIVTKTDLTKLDVGEILKNESLTLTSDGSLAADVSALKTSFAVASSFLTLKGDADARLGDPKNPERVLSPFEQARAINATGNANLPKLYALSTALSPPAVTMDPVTNEPLPPMRIDGGDLAFKLAVARDDARNATRVNLDVPNIDKLQISRGKNEWQPEDKVTLSLAGELTTDLTKATVAEQVQRLVATLDANVPGVLTAKTTTPIDVTNLSAETPNAKGVLAATARLAPLGRLMAAVSGGEPMMMDGDARLEQTIASAGNAITLVGGGRITELLPTGPEAQPLPEALRTIELKNDLSTDLKAMSATIKSLDVVAPQAREVFALGASGTIRELSTNNVFDGMKARLAYDWSQLWPLVRPFADPTGESIGRIDPFVGKYEKTFTISGRYPTARADGTPILFNEAVRSVVVHGDVQIDRMTLVDKGIDVAELSLPLSLKDGIATIAFADGRPPKPAGLNSGRLDLGGLAVNLAGEEPVLIDVEDKKILEGATLNPVLSNALGKFFNPIFPNATKANAKIEVTLSAKDLHLGPSLQTRNSGRAKVVLSLLNLEIANPLSEQLLGGVVNQVAKLSGDRGVDTASLTNLSGELRDATFTLDRGVVRQDVTFMLGNEAVAGATEQPKRYAFGFNGDIRLSDLGMSLNASFPLALLKDKLRGDVGEFLRFAPDQFPVSLTGSTSAPKLDQSALLRAISESFVKAQVARSVAGNRKDGAPAADGKRSDGDKLADVLGGILGGKSAGEIAADQQRQAEAEKQAQSERQAEADRKADADRKARPAARDDDDAQPAKKTQAQKRREAEQRQREEDERKAQDERRRAAQKKPATDDDDPPARRKKKDEK